MNSADRHGVIRSLRLLFPAAGIGTFGTAGLLYALFWFCLAVLHGLSKHPYYTMYIKVAGFICLLCFIAMIVLWISAISTREKKLRDTGISVLCVIAGCVLGFLLVYGLDVLGLYIRELYLT